MKLTAITLLLIILFSMSSYAFLMGSSNYKINAVISGAAGNAEHYTDEDPKYKIYYAGFQQLIRSPLEDTGKYKLCLGIFCMGIGEIPHYVTVRGVAYYDTGEVVADAESKLVVTIGNSNYQSETFMTDANGKFSTKVSVPETIAKKDEFGVKVYITGRIEAVYSCTFHKESETSGSCYN